MVNGGCWVRRLQSVLMEMARGQLTQCCLSIEHTKLDKQMMEQSDRTLFHRNRVKTVTADMGESPRVQTRAFLTWDQRSPWLWRRQESQIWCQASTSSGTCCCSNPSGQRLFSSENRSCISKTRRKPTAFSHFLSRSLDCLPSQLKAPQSLGLE